MARRMKASEALAVLRVAVVRSFKWSDGGRATHPATINPMIILHVGRTIN